MLPARALVLALPVLWFAAGPGLQAAQREPELRILLAKDSSLALAPLGQPLQVQPGTVTLPTRSRATFMLEGGRVHLEVQDPAARRLRQSKPLPQAPMYWLRPVPPATAAEAPGVEGDSGTFQLLERRYHGRLQIRVNGAGLQAINHVPLERYLPAVVGSEMPSTWPLAALQAQAVAARTYALRQRKPADPYDLSATVRHQVYKGLEAEAPSTLEAVRTTRGQVLTYGSKLANTVFHSSSGGLTENSGDLWRHQLPYLVSVRDFDQDSPVHRWEQRFDPWLLRRAFAEIDGVSRIEVLSTTETGRIRQARVEGPRGTLVLSGSQLRTRLQLRSTLVRFELLAPALAFGLPVLPPPPPPIPVLSNKGSAQALPALSMLRTVPMPALRVIGRGYGHGVGMSQWGAHAMALRGDNHAQILRHYYRGTKLSNYLSSP